MSIMITNFEALRPAVGQDVLHLTLTEPAFAEQKEHLNEHLNKLGAQHFVDLANKADADPKTGAQYMLVTHKGFSAEEVILMPGTFGNGIWPHIIARAEALSHSALHAGVRDVTGNPLGVLMVGSPSMNSRFGFDKSERGQMARGDFLPVARRHVALVDDLKFGAVKGAFYSQAAAMAGAFSYDAKKTIDVNHMIVGEIPLNRRGFLTEGREFSQERKKDGIDVIEELFANKQAAVDFERGILHEFKENFAYLRGFGRIMLSNDLVLLANSSEHTTLLHATHSKVMPLNAAVTGYENAKNTLRNLGQADRIQRVQADSNHSFGDRVGSFSAVVAANLAA